MKQAFTLIELLVVVLIIGILSAIALPQYTKAVEKARSAEILQNVSALQKSIDLYLLENGYPSNSVSFLGTTANGKDLLTLDITQGMTCEDISCHNQYSHYQASCQSSVCSIHASRISPGDADYKYHLDLFRRKNDGDAWDEKECSYTEGYDFICIGLEPQGYERISCC